MCYKYSRTSMARTLMARLPRLFRTCCSVPRKKSHSCKVGIIKGVFSFYIENGIHVLCIVCQAGSPGRMF